MIYKQTVLKVLIWVSAFVLFACNEESMPKPQSYLLLEYPEADYHRFVNGCHYSFAISTESNIEFKDNCSAIIDYPRLHAQVHLTYKSIQDNLQEILSDADKLTSKHTVRADAIVPFPFENKETRVFGMMNEVQGESASNVQFYVTDSTHHVVTAALYFKVKPHYDSLYPAVDYVKNDMMNMMETMEWK